MKKFPLLLLLALVCATQALSQTKMLYGSQHIIILDIPAGWLQVQHPQLPFLIKPDKKKVSETTYMYVFGIDYPEHPSMEEFITGNNAHVQSQFPKVEIGSLDQRFAKLDEDAAIQGRYKTITYTYPDKRHEAILVVEGKRTIVTCVLSADGEKEFNSLLPGFIALAGSMLISDAEVQEK